MADVCYNRVMNKTTATALLLLPLSLSAAAPNPEAARDSSNAAFHSLADFHAAMPVTRTVPVSGSVNLTGSGNVPPGAMMVWLNLSGYGSVSDSSGRITSRSTWFNANVNCSVSGGWVHCSDYPTWRVDFYKDGRSVGHGTVRGSIQAQIYAPNGFFTANAYTNLSGNVTIQE